MKLETHLCKYYNILFIYNNPFSVRNPLTNQIIIYFYTLQALNSLLMYALLVITR